MMMNMRMSRVRVEESRVESKLKSHTLTYTRYRCARNYHLTRQAHNF